MSLKDFLADPCRSRSREYLVTTRLVHDLTVAAAARGYDLLVYLPTVDNDGFDVILDDRDRLVPIQLKAVIEGGKARDWEIRRTLLRPRPEDADCYGFESSPDGVGRGGGVILTTVAAVDEAVVRVRYAYTDIDVLSAMWLDLVPLSTSQQERLAKLRDELESESGGGVWIPRSAFLPTPSPDHLLAIAGLHSRADQPWRLQLRKLLRKVHLGVETTVPNEVLRSNIKTYLLNLSSRSKT